MVYLDTFSGCNAFLLGLLQAGYRFDKHYFSEVDPHAIACTRYNYKNSIYVGAIEDVWRIQRPNIITFGSPCQDFSLVGIRKGLNGKRSSLIQHAIKLVRQYKPDVFIWENVEGTFSSNEGRDFQAILREFTNIGGYRLEWQLCNTSWILPQNRPRIYLVGHLATTQRSFTEVFPVEYESAKIASSIEAGYYSENDIIWPLVERRTEHAKKQRSLTGKNSFRDKQIEFRTDGNIGALLGSMGIDNAVYINGQARYLTEIECERLQGFPDDYTKYGMYENSKGVLVKKEISSTQRYKLCGNAVSAGLVRAIGQKLNLN